MEEKRINIRIRLPVKWINKVADMAKNRGISLSKMFEEVISSYVDKNS